MTMSTALLPWSMVRRQRNAHRTRSTMPNPQRRIRSPSTGLLRRPRDLQLGPPPCVRFFALASFMQILVDLANLMNERSVRRPHTLDPGHDLRMRAGILDNSNGLPGPVAESHTVSVASPPPTATRRVPSECHCQVSTSNSWKRAKLASDDRSDGEGPDV